MAVAALLEGLQALTPDRANLAFGGIVGRQRWPCLPGSSSEYKAACRRQCAADHSSLLDQRGLTLITGI